MKKDINYFGFKFQSLLNELKENDMTISAYEQDGCKGFAVTSADGPYCFFPANCSFLSTIPICPITMELHRGMHFYWAMDDGSSDLHIFDHFSFRSEPDYPLAIYGWFSEESLALGAEPTLLGTVSLDAFNKYIFLDEHEARVAAQKFEEGSNE